MQYIFLQFLIPFSCVFIRLDSSSQAIFGHRRPASEARSICHVECCAVETSLDVSRRGEEPQEPRVSRHERCFERCCSYDFRRRCGSWKIEIRGLQLALVPHVPHWRDTRGTWTTFRFPKEFAHCIKFFVDFVNSFKLPSKQYVFVKY